MAKPPKPVRTHLWKIPALNGQNKSLHDGNNIRVFTLEHHGGWYPPPFYRVDMYRPADSKSPEMWIPLMTPNQKNVWYFETLAEAQGKGVSEAAKEMAKWPEPTQLPMLPEPEQQPV